MKVNSKVIAPLKINPALYVLGVFFNTTGRFDTSNETSALIECKGAWVRAGLDMREEPNIMLVS
jgi:hypothetical protein